MVVSGLPELGSVAQEAASGLKSILIRGQLKRDLFILLKLFQVLYSSMGSTCHSCLLPIMFLLLHEWLDTIAIMSVTLNIATS